MLLRTYPRRGVLASAAGIVVAARTSRAKWDHGTPYVPVAIMIVVMAGPRACRGTCCA